MRMLASTVLSAYPAKDMTDEYHYSQNVLNNLGDDAGRHVAYYSNTGNEPEMFDYKYGNTYVPIQ